jgi:hypothetical protein
MARKDAPFKYEVVSKTKFALTTNMKSALKAKREIEKRTGYPAKIRKLKKVM